MSRLFRDLTGGALCPNGSVVCIGAFDGLHLGHYALLRHTVARARSLRLPAVVLSFEPLPREFFATSVPPPRLTLPRAKFESLRAEDADLVGLLRFNARMAAMTPQQFIDQVLGARLSVRELWVGPDFHFGQARAGDLHTLQAAGLSAHAIQPVLVDGERVSSSRIRRALQHGDFENATRLLGRPYAIAGQVVRGNQLGHTLGYPTANLRFGGKMSALSGIYATRVHGITAQPWPAVSSFGTRPTLGGGELLLESHLFDFDGDLYGRRIEVEFVGKLRDELTFTGLTELVAQMDRDAEQARSILQHSSSHGMQPHRRASA